MAINDSSSFADGNLEPRCPVVLVLDVSGSMGGNPITELQQIPIKPTTKQPIEKAQSRCHNDETN
jgi:hypothetical protein